MGIVNREHDIATELDVLPRQDMEETLVEIESVTIHAETLLDHVLDANQPTLCTDVDFEETIEERTKREHPASKFNPGGLSIKRLFTGEEVVISKPIFCIGRKEDVDYPVTHNPAISRNHAEIISRNGRFYIRDLGAKNRTYVNGKLLPAKSESEISNGDVIKLANEDFLVRL